MNNKQWYMNLRKFIRNVIIYSPLSGAHVHICLFHSISWRKKGLQLIISMAYREF